MVTTPRFSYRHIGELDKIVAVNASILTFRRLQVQSLFIIRIFNALGEILPKLPVTTFIDDHRSVIQYGSGVRTNKAHGKIVETLLISEVVIQKLFVRNRSKEFQPYPVRTVTKVQFLSRRQFQLSSLLFNRAITGISAETIREDRRNTDKESR